MNKTIFLYLRSLIGDKLIQTSKNSTSCCSQDRDGKQGPTLLHHEIGATRDSSHCLATPATRAILYPCTTTTAPPNHATPAASPEAEQNPSSQALEPASGIRDVLVFLPCLSALSSFSLLADEIRTPAWPRGGRETAGWADTGTCAGQFAASKMRRNEIWWEYMGHVQPRAVVQILFSRFISGFNSRPDGYASGGIWRKKHPNHEMGEMI
ncbi:Cap-Gly Domain-Containing Linker Protein 1 [Manis pentadactyla]|nr:Cap-Gly Domain-Containing Linker Protein 1 [Manis pentadactyla]